MLQKLKRDWDGERQQLIALLGHIEFMKLWLHEHPQQTLQFVKEFEALAQKYIKGYNDQDMVEFRIGISKERWAAYSAACEIAEGSSVDQCHCERKAREAWLTAIDAVIKYYRTDEEVTSEAI